MRLGAALFNADHGRLADEIARLEQAGVDFLHLDVFDGCLVRDLAFSPQTVAQLRPLTRLPFEVHLAAVDPERFLPALAEADVDLVLVHAEGPSMLYEALFAVREHGMRVGVALGLATPFERVEAALPFVDCALMLSRVTGEGSRGASFDERVLPRLRRARAAIDEHGVAVELQSAGGVGRRSLALVAAAGAEAAAVGAGLFRADDLGAEVAQLRRIAREVRRSPTAS